MAAQNGKLAIYAEQTQQAADNVEEGLNNPPLPASIFKQELYRQLDQNYNQGIYKTGKKVTERLYRRFVKPTSEVSVQTESIRQLTMKYEHKIEDLEKQIETMQEEYQRATADAARLNQRCRDLNQFRIDLVEQLAHLNKDYDKIKDGEVAMKQMEGNLRRDLQETR